MARIGKNLSNPLETQRKGNLFWVKLLKYLDIPFNFTLQISPFLWVL